MTESDRKGQKERDTKKETERKDRKNETDRKGQKERDCPKETERMRHTVECRVWGRERKRQKE